MAENELLLGDSQDATLLKDSGLNIEAILATTSSLSSGVFDSNDDTAPIETSLQKAQDVMSKSQDLLRGVNSTVQAQIKELEEAVKEPNGETSKELKRLKNSFKRHKNDTAEHNKSLKDSQERYDALQSKLQNFEAARNSTALLEEQKAKLQEEIKNLKAAAGASTESLEKQEVKLQEKINNLKAEGGSDESLEETKKALQFLAAEIAVAEAKTEELERAEAQSKHNLEERESEIESEKKERAKSERSLKRLGKLNLNVILKMEIVAPSNNPEIEQDNSLVKRWDTIVAHRAELVGKLSGFVASKEELYSGDLSQVEEDINAERERANNLSSAILHMCKLDALLLSKSILLKAKDEVKSDQQALKLRKDDLKRTIGQINELLPIMKKTAEIIDGQEDTIKGLRKDLKNAKQALEKELKSTKKDSKSLVVKAKKIKKPLKEVNEEISNADKKLSSAKKLSGNYSKHISLLSDLSKMLGNLKEIQQNKESLEAKRQEGLSRNASFKVVPEEEAPSMPATRSSSPVPEGMSWAEESAGDVSLADELGAFDPYAYEQAPAAEEGPAVTEGPVATSTPKKAPETKSRIKEDAFSTAIPAAELAEPDMRSAEGFKAITSDVAPMSAPAIPASELAEPDMISTAGFKAITSDVAPMSAPAIAVSELAKPDMRSAEGFKAITSDVAPASAPAIPAAKLPKPDMRSAEGFKAITSDVAPMSVPSAKDVEVLRESIFIKAPEIVSVETALPTGAEAVAEVVEMAEPKEASKKSVKEPAQIIVSEPDDGPSAKRARTSYIAKVSAVESAPASTARTEQVLDADQIMQILSNMVASNTAIIGSNNVSSSVSSADFGIAASYTADPASLDVLNNLPSEVSDALLELMRNMHASKPENVTRDHTVAYNNEGQTHVNDEVYNAIARFLGGGNNDTQMLFGSDNRGTNMSPGTQNFVSQALREVMGEMPSLLSDASTGWNSTGEDEKPNNHDTQSSLARRGRRYSRIIVDMMPSAA